MQATINGEIQALSEGSTVASLIGTLGLDTQKVAIEVNLAIVPRSLYGETLLSDGDRIEIVQFIGGG
jgi:thiamine biosynthesis protein ThiS